MITLDVTNVLTQLVGVNVQNGPPPRRTQQDPRTPWGSNWIQQSVTLPDNAAGTQVAIQFSQHTTEQGFGWATLIDNVEIVDYFANIVRPQRDLVFGYLVSSGYTQTDDIVFEGMIPQTSASMNWTLSNRYVTTGGRCAACNTAKTFSSPGSPVTVTQRYEKEGGEVTVQAITNNGIPVCPDSRFYVVGTTIPAADVQARLRLLYAGPTRDLMYGISLRESSARHFCLSGSTCTGGQPNLFGIHELWPHESFDGGSHIGLMMMPVSMLDAWDWLTNTQDGVDLFNGFCLTRALANQTSMKNSLPGGASIRDLSSTELENMQLGIYRFGDRGATNNYYKPVKIRGNNWDWVRNTTTMGLEVIDYVSGASGVRTQCGCAAASPTP